MKQLFRQDLCKYKLFGGGGCQLLFTGYSGFLSFVCDMMLESQYRFGLSVVPNVERACKRNRLITFVNIMDSLGVDLNFKVRNSADFHKAGLSHAPRQICFRAIDATFASHYVSTLCRALSGTAQSKTISCLDQFLCMSFAQLTFRVSLRDIQTCLRAQRSKLYHLGIRSSMARNTLSNANAVRDWKIYADFAQHLIAIARPLYSDEDLGADLKNTVYALDTTTIDLCLSVFPWAHFRSTKAAVKLHMLLDLRGNIPSFIHISDGKLHEVNVLDQLLPEAGAFYIMDRGFTDFSRLYRFHEAGSFFVIRGKSNLKVQRRYSAPVDRSTGLICDQTVAFTGFYSHKDFEAPLRRIRFKDPATRKTLVFLTNNFALPALTIAELYRCRWQVELFFKWIKQHLRIKAFFGTSKNAVKTQIWIAVSVYVLVAIVKKRLKVTASLYEILQILSLTLFERIPIDQLLTQIVTDDFQESSENQLFLFE